MAARVPARLTAAQQGRRFGLTVGAAFLALGAIVLWRGGRTAAAVLGAIGALLVLAALAVPGHLGPVERGWMALAHAISRVTTPLILGLIYYLAFTPMGLARRALGRDALSHGAGGSRWTPRPADARRSDLQRQF